MCIRDSIRVIRRIHSVANLMGADIYQLPFTTWYYPYFYRFSKQFPFIDMLKFKLFKFSFNLNDNAIGMKFYSGDSARLNTNHDILIDGSGGTDGIIDSLSRNKPFWTMVTGDPGTMFTINKVKYFGDQNYSWRLFYADTLGVDDISIGDHGIIFTSSNLNVGLHTQNRIYLLKRNSEEAVELAKFELPLRFEKTVCLLKGVYAPEGELKEWLKKELNVA